MLAKFMNLCEADVKDQVNKMGLLSEEPETIVERHSANADKFRILSKQLDEIIGAMSFATLALAGEKQGNDMIVEAIKSMDRKANDLIAEAISTLEMKE